MRDSARTYGKSDPIDALAVARAALREPGLPTARLDGPEREVRLLTDHREDLVGERTRAMNRLRWHLHELDPDWDLAPRALTRKKTITAVTGRLAGMDGLVARLAADLAGRIETLTDLAGEMAHFIDPLDFAARSPISRLLAEGFHRDMELARQLAPSLLALRGVAELTAAKIVGETAGVDRFRSEAAYARHNGTAPLPVWSANKTRHRLSRTGNRQLNCAIHRIAVTQLRCHPKAQAYFASRIAAGNSKAEALRALKRQLSDVVYRRLLADIPDAPSRNLSQAA